MLSTSTSSIVYSVPPTVTVGYTSPNLEVMEYLSGEEGDFYGIDAYIPRADNENDEVFTYDPDTRVIISDLWSRVKIAASNAG